MLIYAILLCVHLNQCPFSASQRAPFPVLPLLPLDSLCAMFHKLDILLPLASSHPTFRHAFWRY